MALTCLRLATTFTSSNHHQNGAIIKRLIITTTSAARQLDVNERLQQNSLNSEDTIFYAVLITYNDTYRTGTTMIPGEESKFFYSFFKSTKDLLVECDDGYGHCRFKFTSG
jgi:hypothetical protein